MIRKLFITAGVGVLLSLGCLAASASLVHHDLDTTGWNWKVVKIGDHVRFIKGEAAKPLPVATRTLTWSGGDILTADIDADVEYSQSDTTSVTVTGPQADIDRVRVEGGRIFMIGNPEHQEDVNFHWGPDGIDAQKGSGKLTILISAPSIRHFQLSGDGDLSVRGYDQPTLDLTVTGSGSAEATGRTDALKVNLSGSGDADLSGLQAKDADVALSGSGNTEVAAMGKATVDISGSGNVELTTKPASVSSHLSGSGSLDQD